VFSSNPGRVAAEIKIDLPHPRNRLDPIFRQLVDSLYACMTQRPDLFGAALPGVGVMDMLRFHKFTIGWSWVSDYGSPEDPEEFKTLAAYSPYHNIRPGVRYPPTMITTGDHDDRVVPGHSYKYAAALQAAQEGPAPILIRIEVRAGHGLGKPVSKQIGEVVDILAFLVKVLAG